MSLASSLEICDKAKEISFISRPARADFHVMQRRRFK